VTRAAQRGRRWIAAAVAAGVVSGCAYNYSGSETGESLPAVVPHRDSMLVTVSTSRQRMLMHHEGSSFWYSGGESIVGMEKVGESCHDLDVRTCKTAWRLRCGPAMESDVSIAERAMIGSVRYAPDQANMNLQATDTRTGQTWTAATGFGQILSVTAVPAARRVVVVTTTSRILVYELDAKRVVACSR
jgi:hypothetical protein